MGTVFAFLFLCWLQLTAILWVLVKIAEHLGACITVGGCG